MLPGFCWPSRVLWDQAASFFSQALSVERERDEGESHAFWKGQPSCRDNIRGERRSWKTTWEALTVPVRTGSGLGQMENNKASQQNLKVNWLGVLGRGSQGNHRSQPRSNKKA